MRTERREVVEYGEFFAWRFLDLIVISLSILHNRLSWNNSIRLEIEDCKRDSGQDADNANLATPGGTLGLVILLLRLRGCSSGLRGGGGSLGER